MAFETAIFTDVTADEAVDGYDGFNFQSVSPGVDGTDMRNIREGMLHVVSPHWPLSAEATDHPPTAAFSTRDGRFYLSKGVSTGNTASGRSGNQLTQAIVTTDVGDLSPYVPAQVLGARNWSLQKAENKTSDTWSPPLDIDPALDAAALIEWVQEDEWRRSVLPTYLTMLRSAVATDGGKAVIVCSDIDEFTKWAALGTVLLEREAAMGTEFRAFVSDPFRTQGTIMGVHPDLSGSSLSGAQVLDAVQHSTSPIEVSPEAETIAGWVLELDPYDALEVVALATRWFAPLGAAGAKAAAEMVSGVTDVTVGRSEWEIGVAAVQALSAAGLKEDLDMYFDELIASVSTYKLEGAADFQRSGEAAGAASAANSNELAAALVETAVEQLLSTPEHASSWATSLLGSGGNDVLAQVDAPVEQVIELVNVAPVQAVLPLLSLLSRASSTPSSADVEPALKLVVRHQLADPGSLEDPGPGWLGEERVRADLRTGLIKALTVSGGPERADLYHQFREGAWDFLKPPATETGDEAVILRAHLVAAELGRAERHDRQRLLEDVATDMRPGTEVLALAGTDPVDDNGLWVGWIQKVGASPAMRAQVLEGLAGATAGDPMQARAADVEPWVALNEAVAEAHPADLEVAERLAAGRAYLEAIPSALGRSRARLGAMFGRGGRKSAEQGEES